MAMALGPSHARRCLANAALPPGLICSRKFGRQDGSRFAWKQERSNGVRSLVCASYI